MKNMAEKGKIGVKKRGFRGKMGVIGLEKTRAFNQNRKAKWCKTQVVFSKKDKTEGIKNNK